MSDILLNDWHRSLYTTALSLVCIARDVYLSYAWIPLALWQSAFYCGHPNTIPGEGKSFCPDCGEGIVYQWKVLRCNCCNARLDTRYILRRWIPAYPFCRYCGESSFREESFDNPRFHQLYKAYLFALPAREFEKHFQPPRKQKDQNRTYRTVNLAVQRELSGSCIT